MRKKIVAGNWKMNNDLTMTTDLIESVKSKLNFNTDTQVFISPSFPFLHEAIKKCKGTTINVTAQNINENESGAYTGEVSSSMLKSIGINSVIIGHSERRQYFNESTKLIADKIKTAHKLNLKVILCIGELKSEIRNRKKVLRNQLKSIPLNPNHKNLIIAYEPVWAIGTGLTPSLLEINEIHSSIRSILKSKLDFSNKVSILYGGSVNAKNAKEILSLNNVDGALVGGASLQISEFSKIIDYS